MFINRIDIERKHLRLRNYHWNQQIEVHVYSKQRGKAAMINKCIKQAQ